MMSRLIFGIEGRLAGSESRIVVRILQQSLMIRNVLCKNYQDKTQYLQSGKRGGDGTGVLFKAATGQAGAAFDKQFGGCRLQRIFARIFDIRCVPVNAA